MRAALVCAALGPWACSDSVVLIGRDHPPTTEPIPVVEGVCASSDECADDEWCARAECGATSGTCAFRPDICSMIYAPVCGCDNQTYSSPCDAAAVEMSIAHDGECCSMVDCPEGTHCESQPTDCGDPPCPHELVCVTDEICDNWEDCGVGQVCANLPGSCDGPGICSVQPMGCLDTYTPVCGCDGVHYWNQCIAWSAGVGVGSDTDCTATNCGEVTCPSGQVCFVLEVPCATPPCPMRPICVPSSLATDLFPLDCGAIPDANIDAGDGCDCVEGGLAACDPDCDGGTECVRTHAS